MALKDVVSDLAARVAQLEARQGRTVASVVDGDVEAPEGGRVVYSGIGPWQERAVVWQMERTWTDVLSTDPESLSRVLASLASPVRLRIVATLVDGPVATGDLADRVGAGTSGQLFHHVKELLAIGVVHQPQRGVYALRPQHVVPLLAVLSAALDLAAGDEASRS